MHIWLNNTRIELSSRISLAELLQQHSPGKGFAVTVNGELIVRSQFVQTPLKDQDRIDLIVPMQGG